MSVRAGRLRRRQTLAEWLLVPCLSSKVASEVGVATLMIGYDLDEPGQNYEAVSDAIKSLSSTWWHRLDSTWLVKTTLNATQARDRIWAVMDSNDELLVINITGDAWAAQGFDSYKWLKDNMSG
jgi:hypothetical protein